MRNPRNLRTLIGKISYSDLSEDYYSYSTQEAKMAEDSGLFSEVSLTYSLDLAEALSSLNVTTSENMNFESEAAEIGCEILLPSTEFFLSETSILVLTNTSTKSDEDLGK